MSKPQIFILKKKMVETPENFLTKISDSSLIDGTSKPVSCGLNGKESNAKTA
jgi:hypothetical protein